MTDVGDNTTIKRNRKWIGQCMIALSFLIYHLMIVSCARMGAPDGGWYDDKPPYVVGASPAERGTNVTSKKINIYFNEFIKIDDAQSKVVVSPTQLEMPEIKAKGKYIVVELKDSLKDNTTYTIDFSDAISDNNEGNPMGNYTFSFSTGEEIDTFEVAGYVLNAEDLEPIKGMLVGLYDDLSDTVFQKKPFLRVSRTNGSGHFVIKGVKSGQYRVYGLQDADGNYLFNQKSEMIAFSHDIITPTCAPDIRQDTIWRDSLHIDSIARVPYIHYYPDELTLLAFTEKQTDKYLIKTDRTDERKFQVFFSGEYDSLPKIRGLNFNDDSAFVAEPSQHNDSIVYWIRDTMLVNTDSLELEIQYMKTDSMGLLVSQTDTIIAVPKISYERRMKLKNKEIEKWQKEQERLKKHDEPYDSIMPEPKLEIKYNIQSSMSPFGRITLESPTPITQLDTSKIHLYSKIDTLWYRAPFIFRPVKGKMREYEVLANWHLNTEYSFEVDSAAFTDIYGAVSDDHVSGLKIKSMDDFSTLVVNISGLNDSCDVYVELLDGSDKPKRKVKVNDGSAEFFYLDPGTYYMRAFADNNGNARWDTGDYAANRQAEAVYYHPTEIECKAKWDLTRDWNVTATPHFRQKPGKIVKQKPDKEKKVMNRNLMRAVQLNIPLNQIPQ